MKKFVIGLIALCITLSGCNSERSGSSLFGSEKTETPIPTPTYTPGQEFCANYTLSQTEMENFREVNDNFIEFLALESNQGLKYSQILELSLIADPLGIDAFNTLYPDFYTEIIDLTNEMMNKGIELQIALHRGVIPTQIAFTYQQVTDCVEIYTDFSSSIYYLYTSGAPFDYSINLQECSNIGVYYQEITDFCASQ